MSVMPQVNYIKCKNPKEEYRMFYTTWGSQEFSSQTLLCVHGLNRNSRDWDYVGRHFAKQGYYVVAPDIVGRGNSDYLKDPAQYDIPFYVADVMTLIKVLGLSNIHFIGTSMGGLIGMGIACMENHPLGKLVLNDIGAEIDSAGLKRIAGYSGKEPEFQSYTQAKDYLIDISRDFGDLPDDVWEHYARCTLQKDAAGKYYIKRDASLSKPFSTTMPGDKNMELWPFWEKIKLPTLVVRGANSDLLSRSTVERMKQINPATKSIEVANAGHAPYLYNQEHFNFLEQFFKA